MRLIDADELKRCAIPCEIHNGALTDLCVPLYQIYNAPTVEERLQGKWIIHDREYLKYGCNQCGNLTNINSNFCPNCGADMKGGTECSLTPLDIKTIQEAIIKFDMMLRPCALFLSPSRVSELKESIPDIEEKVLLIPSEMVPDDKFYLIDRKDLTPEHYLTGGIE